MLQRGMSLQALPEAHTCFKTLDVPHYADVGTARAKLLLAVRDACGEFGMR